MKRTRSEERLVRADHESQLKYRGLVLECSDDYRLESLIRATGESSPRGSFNKF